MGAGFRADQIKTVGSYRVASATWSVTLTGGTVLLAPVLPPRGGNGACALCLGRLPYGHRYTGLAPPPRGGAGAVAFSLLGPLLALSRHRVC